MQNAGMPSMMKIYPNPASANFVNISPTKAMTVTMTNVQRRRTSLIPIAAFIQLGGWSRLVLIPAALFNPLLESCSSPTPPSNKKKPDGPRGSSAFH